MTHLVRVRDEVACQLYKVIKPVPVNPHAGRFDEAELKRLATKCPAVYLAILGLSKVVDNSSFGVVATAQFGAFVITKDQPGYPRDESSLTLVSALTAHIPGNDWGLDEVTDGAIGITGRNLYGAQIERYKVAMWAVTWQQSIQLGSVIGAGEFDGLLNFEAMMGEHAISEDSPTAQSNIILNQES